MPMPSTDMVRHRLDTGLIHSNIVQQPSEHSVGRKS